MIRSLQSAIPLSLIPPACRRRAFACQANRRGASKVETGRNAMNQAWMAMALPMMLLAPGVAAQDAASDATRAAQAELAKWLSLRPEEQTAEFQTIMRLCNAGFRFNQKKHTQQINTQT